MSPILQYANDAGDLAVIVVDRGMASQDVDQRAITALHREWLPKERLTGPQRLHQRM